MKIGGYIKNSLIDYPGKISSIIFTQGCNMRCRYCHNPELVLPKIYNKLQSISENIIFEHLEKNKKNLDAVVITGGEPTIQKNLIDFMVKIKSLNLEIKLDTNGTNPKLLEKVIELKLVDFIAMDIKAPLDREKYSEIAGDFVNIEIIDKIKKSIWVIIKSGVKHEFRTTTIKKFHTKEDLFKICESIKGCDSFCLQDFNPEITLEKDFNEFKNYTAPVLEWLSKDVKDIIENVKVR